MRTRCMRGLVSWVVFVALVQAQAPSAARAQAQVPAALDAAIKAETSGFAGKVWVFAKNLDSGATYSLRGKNRVRTASTIKLPILIALHAAVAAGKATWTDQVVLTKEKRVSGSGVLTEFADGTTLTLRDAANLMIVVSDNIGTNLVLDAIGTDYVNETLDSLGFRKTRSLRRIGGGGASRANDDPTLRLFGIGVSTSQEMVEMLERLERGTVVSAEASKDMIDTLKREQYSDGIGRVLFDVTVASKAGALDRLRSDIGIVYSRRGRIAMAITVDDMPNVHYTVDNPGLLLISRISEILIDGLGTPDAGR